MTGGRATVAPPSRCVVFIPAFNEAATIAAVVERARTARPADTVLVVDDGSADETGRLAREAGAEVVRFPANRGIFAANVAGFEFCRDKGFAGLIQIDADGQHDPGEIHRLQEASGFYDAGIVIGSRYLGRSSETSAARFLGMKVFAALISFLGDRRVTDTTTGFRFYRTDAIPFLLRLPPAAFIDGVSLLRLQRDGVRIVEIPAELKPRMSGQSRFTPLRSLRFTVGFMLRLAWEAIRIHPRTLRRDLLNAAAAAWALAWAAIYARSFFSNSRFVTDLLARF